LILYAGNYLYDMFDERLKALAVAGFSGFVHKGIFPPLILFAEIPSNSQNYFFLYKQLPFDLLKLKNIQSTL
jgi:hypothetical protein